MRTQVAGVVFAFMVSMVSGCRSAGTNGVRLDVPPSWLVYDTAGDGDPVVLLQGAQVGRGLWDAEFQLLAKEYFVVRYDVRGFGESGPESAPFRHHEDLRILLDHLGLDRVALVGLSLGGRIALDFALENPERVNAMVLVAPGMSGWQWGDDDSWDEIAAAIADGDARQAAQSWLEHPYMAPAMEQPELRERLRDLALANADVWTREQHELELDPPATERLGELRVPVLAMIGSRDVDDIKRIVDLLEARVANFRRVDADGAGHVLNLERAEWFQREVLGFLRAAHSKTPIDGSAGR